MQQTPVPFEQFAAAARIAARPAYWQRSMKRYEADVRIGEVSGRGYDLKDKQVAVENAINSAYATYCDRIAHDNRIDAFTPLFEAVKIAARREVAKTGWTVDEFRWRHDLRAFVLRVVDPACPDLWNHHSRTVDLSLDAPEDLTPQIVRFCAPLAQAKQDNVVYARWQALSRKRLHWLDKLPRAYPKDCKPGDVLISERREFFQVESVSPTGVKIMISRPYHLAGCSPLERLDKHEKETRYHVTTYPELVRQFEMGKRMETVSERMEEREKKRRKS